MIFFFWCHFLKNLIQRVPSFYNHTAVTPLTPAYLLTLEINTDCVISAGDKDPIETTQINEISKFCIRLFCSLEVNSGEEHYANKSDSTLPELDQPLSTPSSLSLGPLKESPHIKTFYLPPERARGSPAQPNSSVLFVGAHGPSNAGYKIPMCEVLGIANSSA